MYMSMDIYMYTYLHIHTGVLVLDWREVGAVRDVWNLVRGVAQGAVTLPQVWPQPPL